MAALLAAARSQSIHAVDLSLLSRIRNLKILHSNFWEDIKRCNLETSRKTFKVTFITGLLGVAVIFMFVNTTAGKLVNCYTYNNYSDVFNYLLIVTFKLKVRNYRREMPHAYYLGGDIVFYTAAACWLSTRTDHVGVRDVKIIKNMTNLPDCLLGRTLNADVVVFNFLFC